jgi:chorismate synthase
MEILGGPLFGVAGAGESHGPGVTTIVFGCPPGLRIDRARVQRYLDRRRPGSNKLATPRQEADEVVFLSGLYSEDHSSLLGGPEIRITGQRAAVSVPSYGEGYTTGEPIAALVLSAAKRSADYAQFAGPHGAVRPGHTDLVKHYQSMGFVDVRGGGRSSYRATISDVVGGSIARIYLAEQFGTAILSSICQVGPLRSSTSLAESIEALRRRSPTGRLSPEEIAELESRLESGEIRTLDRDFAGEAARLIAATRKAGDSLGAVVEVVAVNVPALVGEPLYHSLKVRLMGALGGLNAAQACEIGSGTEVAARRGSENNDPIRRNGYQTNHHGGLIGGITTGAPIVCRVSFKPTATIALPQPSVRKDLEEIEFRLRKGRHDPCVGVRAGVTLESRLAVELMNGVLMRQASTAEEVEFRLFNRGAEQ